MHFLRHRRNKWSFHLETLMKIQCPKISPLIFRKRKRGTYESCTVLISIYLPSQNGEDPSNCNCVFSLQVNISCPTRVKPGWHLYLAKSPERVMNSNNNKVLTFKMEKKNQAEVHQYLRCSVKYINSLL